MALRPAVDVAWVVHRSPSIEYAVWEYELRQVVRARVSDGTCGLETMFCGAAVDTRKHADAKQNVGVGPSPRRQSEIWASPTTLRR